MSVIPGTITTNNGNAVAGSSKVRMKIDVTSDITCPFCLIGMKQLLAAIEQYRLLHPSIDLEPTIRLLPFQLNPALSEVPQEKGQYLEKKFGKEKMVAIRGMVDDKLRAMGVKPTTGGLVSSTHLVHRLQTYTLLKHPELQLPLAMSLFSLVHEAGVAPSDRSALASVAVQHGVFPSLEEALRFFESDECDAEVKRAYTMARRVGVTGVPFFVFQDRYAASGAMGVDEFVKLFEEIIRRSETISSPSPTESADSQDSVSSPGTAGTPYSATSAGAETKGD
ncbi:hypothetical protein EHS25_006316 [Saitozyma podzolica]|uniref:DSBA-like thioredoxin domain-containing protein n=1 Tax=Saitozyma podzolica TaxID=1890683 RepID=A0A427YRI6_9TREE|nr:hypothetical protein EHS25_006316 [Saitozyma podzolica]